MEILRLARQKGSGNQYYTIGSTKYKNRDVVNAISYQIFNYFKTHRQSMPWKFYDWHVKRGVEPIKTEEDSGIFRNDITLELKYYDNLE